MNKKVTIIFILTIIALGYLTYYSFGPSSSEHLIPMVNPESLKPTPISAEDQVNKTLEVYHNMDVVENHYAISIPVSWKLQASTLQAGEYQFIFDSGAARVKLMDVPDNTTLELFILSQDEPSLKKSLDGYKRIDYQKLNISGNDAYQLTYLSDVNGTIFESIRTYITGSDQAAVITLALQETMAESMKNTFSRVINSFVWENK